MKRTAKVVINRPAKQLNKIFSYDVPGSFGEIPVGTRVTVPLGGSREEGIIVGYEEDIEAHPYKVRSVLSVLDSEPWFTDEMLSTAKRMATYYLCSISETVGLFTIDKQGFKSKGSYERPKEMWLIAGDGLHPALVTKNKRKQRELIELLAEIGEASFTELKRLGFSLPVIRQVAALDGVRSEERYALTKTKYKSVETVAEIPMTTAQMRCYEAIRCAAEAGRADTFLLHGVTGSGKTQVYMRAVRDCIEKNRIAVVLVPEIILTDQIVRRFVEVFGDEVVVFHSKLTKSERYNNWERLRRKDSRIIIGARSAVFAPTDDIGLIVMDEEHDTSYKQEEGVKYHARNVARMRAEAHGCPLVLGSATPSVESYYRAKSGVYALLEMPERIQEKPLPKITVVDMKEELFFGNRSVFSDALRTLIADTLANKRQVILLLNRRGYSTFVLCRECGKTVMCPHCDISMVYHKENAALRCHYCEHTEAVPTLCPSCGSSKIKFFGTGTQKAEEALKTEFPTARIARLDQDVAAKKGEGEVILADFAAGRYDILMGTQMVSKGHDFENVTGVGVLTADSVLNIPRYSAAERAFALLTQTAGRAGRGTEEGKVVIQTYNPSHYAIIKSKTHDVEGFYEEEISHRQPLRYPPFGQIIQIKVSHRNEAKAMETAERLVEELEAVATADTEVIGPYDDGARRVRETYRQSILLRADDLTDIKAYMISAGVYARDGIVCDVDPI